MACSTEGQMDRRVQQFNKIYQLNDLTNKIIEKIQCEDNTNSLPKGTFEEVVDLNNAHMSLTYLMHMAENRYAIIVSNHLNEMDAIKEVVYQYGVSLAIECEHIDEMTNYVLSNILDGMPCDETYILLENEDNRIVWQKIVDTHAPFWNDVNNYYILMNEYVRGMLSKTSFSFTIKNNEIFMISK